jgi:hypothetical protein
MKSSKRGRSRKPPKGRPPFGSYAWFREVEERHDRELIEMLADMRRKRQAAETEASMAFEVGQRVVCIDARPGPGYVPTGETLPREGVIYTVREVVPASTYGYEVDCLYLAEIINRPRRYRCPALGSVICEMNFRSSRFRPLRPTRIAVFRQMLERASASDAAKPDLEPASS